MNKRGNGDYLACMWNKVDATLIKQNFLRTIPYNIKAVDVFCKNRCPAIRTAD